MTSVTAERALERIQQFASANRIVLTRHALARSAPLYEDGRGGTRGIRFADIRNALVHSRNCRTADPEYPERWKVDGPDLDGDDITCVVVIEQDVIVITVM